MQNIPLLSIITPVYNVEAYLDRCVRSILSQSYRDIELILIDDVLRTVLPLYVMNGQRKILVLWLYTRKMLALVQQGMRG